MKKVAKRDERRRSTATRKNSSSKLTNSQPSSSAQSSAPRRLKNKLYICGLLPTVLREELIREFGKYGKLHDVWVAKKPPGFAFVEYINSRDAERVVHELDDTKVLGSKVRIEFAKANKGPEDSKKPKKLLPLGGSGSSGSKLLSGKPVIAPLMGQLIVPSLLTASLSSSLSLLGSPPLSGLPLSASSLAGPNYKRVRSPRDSKRYRDSGSHWESGLGRKAISPLIRRFSRSPDGRGRMLSPPPKRSLVMPTSPFSRLSRSQRTIPSLLPPPPSRDVDTSPSSKLMRLTGAALRRFSRSPIRTGSLRRVRRSLSRTRERNLSRISPIRAKRSGNSRLQRSISPMRNQSLSHHRSSASHFREISASLRRNFVKSQVNTVKRNKKMSRSCSPASRSSYGGGKNLSQSLAKADKDASAGLKRSSRNAMASPARTKKQYNVRGNSSCSKSVSRSPVNHRKGLEHNMRQSRSSSKSSVNSTFNRAARRRSPSGDNVSLDRRTSRSSNRRGSLSLRRNFYRSPDRCYSRDRSPPLNFVRTRLLGRTPPSPPGRNSKSLEIPENNLENRQKSASNSPIRSDDNRMSRSRSYESRHSIIRSHGHSVKSRCTSFASSAVVQTKSTVLDNRRRSVSTSRNSSRSTSSSHTTHPKMKKRRDLNLKLVEERKNVKELDKSKSLRHSKLGNRRGSVVSDSTQNRATQKKRSHSVESGSPNRKKVCVRSRGRPRSPSGSPDLQPSKCGRLSRQGGALHVKRSSSSKSRNSICPSEQSRNVSTGRKTPLAYQCPRESVSPPARKKEFQHSKSPVNNKSPHNVSSRAHGKARSNRRDKEASRRGAATPPGEAERFKKEFRRSPSYHDRHRVRYYKSPPPIDHRHYRMLEDEMAMRLERSRASYYDDHHMDSRSSGFYRRSEYPGETEKGYYRRPSPPAHLPPPPLPSYSYRRIPDVQYQRTGRIRCEEVDQFYRTSDPYRGRVHNPPIIYRTSANAVYSRQRPYRR